MMANFCLNCLIHPSRLKWQTDEKRVYMLLVYLILPSMKSKQIQPYFHLSTDIPYARSAKASSLHRSQLLSESSKSFHAISPILGPQNSMHKGSLSIKYHFNNILFYCSKNNHPKRDTLMDKDTFMFAQHFRLKHKHSCIT